MLVGRGPSRPFLCVEASRWRQVNLVKWLGWHQLAGLKEFMNCYCKLSLLSQEPIHWQLTLMFWNDSHFGDLGLFIGEFALIVVWQILFRNHSQCAQHAYALVQRPCMPRLGTSREKQGIRYHHDLLVHCLHYRGTTMPTLKSIQMQSMVQIPPKEHSAITSASQIKLLKCVILRYGTRTKSYL